MRIIGLDPGLTSPAIAARPGHEIVTVVIDTKKLRGMERIKHIIDEVVNIDYPPSLIPEFIANPPDKIIMEGYAYGRIHQMAALGELCGIIKWEATNREIEVIIIPPTSLKKFATGKGNANKESMRDAANKERQKDGLPWLKTHDEADAYWLLRIGEEIENESLGLPKYRQEVLKQVREANS